MDILSVVVAVFKRWYVTVPIMLAALVGAYYVHSTIPPQYEARGQILLASPDLDPEGLPRTVVNLGEVAGETATGAAEAQVVEGGADLRVTARIGVLDVDVSGPSLDVVEATYANAIAWLADAVEQRQEDAGISAEEQLILRQDGEATVNERDEGGFEVSAQLALVDPAAGTPNPFGANNSTARIIIVAIQSDAGRLRVEGRTGPGVEFSVGQDTRDAAAIVNITTIGADPQQVIEGYDHVADVFEAELNEREQRAEVPETRRTRIERIAEPQRVTDISPPLDRSVAAIIGLGGMLALIAAVTWESIASRRRTMDDAATPPRGPEGAAASGVAATQPELLEQAHDRDLESAGSASMTDQPRWSDLLHEDDSFVAGTGGQRSGDS